MMKMIATVGFLIALLNPVMVNAQPNSQIIIVGTAQHAGVPDMAQLSFGVTSNAKRADEAMEETRKQVNKLISGLKHQGFDAKQMQTTQINLSPRIDYNNDNEIIGFTASTQLELTVFDLERLGNVVSDAVRLGANGISQFRFDLRDRDALTGRAEEDAVRDAISRASRMAKTAGLALGRVVSIDATGQAGGAQPMLRASFAARDSGEAMSIEAGEITVSASVKMVFELLE